MSQWHRHHPELIGTEADPWMMHESYRQSILTVERECAECGRFTTGVGPDGLCRRCENHEGG